MKTWKNWSQKYVAYLKKLLYCPEMPMYGPKLKIYVEKYAEELSVISTLWVRARQTSCKTSCKLSTSERVIQMATNALMTCFIISKSFFKRRFVKSIHTSFSFWMTKWQQMLGISAGLNSNLLSLSIHMRKVLNWSTYGISGRMIYIINFQNINI